MNTPSTRIPRPVLQRLGTLLGGAAAALLLGELAMRQVCYVPRVLDPELGFVSDEGDSSHWTLEGSGTAHHQTRAVRGVWNATKHPHPILVTGDSMTEAVEVDDDEVFTSVAERELEAHGVVDGVINVGVQGQRTPVYVSLAPAYRARFAPAWNVVALNDDDLAEDMFATTSSYFSGGASGAPLVLHEAPPAGASFTRRVYRNIRSHSALIQRSALQFQALAADMRRTHLFHAQERPVDVPARNASDYPVHAALDLLFDAFHGQLTLLFMSSFDPAAPSTSTSIEEAVLDYCTTRRTSCVFARSAWPAFAARQATPYGFPNSGWNRGHPNAEGHRAFGVLLANELVRLSALGLF